MNAALKWKLVAGFALAFVAGCVTGGYFGASGVRHLRADFPPHHFALAERMRSRMQSQLDLTPAQLEKTAPIFDHAASELEKIRAETGQRVRQVLLEANRALGPELTDAQRARLETLEKQPHPNRWPPDASGRRRQKPPAP